MFCKKVFGFVLVSLFSIQSAYSMVEKLILLRGATPHKCPLTIIIVGITAEKWGVEELCSLCPKSFEPSSDDMLLDRPLENVMKGILKNHLKDYFGKRYIHFMIEARESKKSPQFPSELLSFYEEYYKKYGNSLNPKLSCEGIWDEKIGAFWKALFNPFQNEKAVCEMSEGCSLREFVVQNKRAVCEMSEGRSFGEYATQNKGVVCGMDGGRTLGGVGTLGEYTFLNEGALFEISEEGSLGEYEDIFRDLHVKYVTTHHLLKTKRFDRRSYCEKVASRLLSMIRDFRALSEKIGKKKNAFEALRRSRVRGCGKVYEKCRRCVRCCSFDLLSKISTTFWAVRYFVNIFDRSYSFGGRKTPRTVVLVCEHSFADNLACMTRELGFGKTEYSFRPGGDEADRLDIDATLIPLVTKCFINNGLWLCNECGKIASCRCSECECAMYCSRECQVADWKSHKKYCKLFKILLVKEKKK